MTKNPELVSDTSWCEVRMPSGRVILLRGIDDALPPAEEEEGENIEDVRFRGFEFEGIAATLREIGDLVGSAIAPLAPYEAGIELGLGLSAKTGQLIALFGDAAANASVKITLNWRFGEKCAHDDEA